jgi:teichuronic acid biosynthesis glycosyltransferase TuaG
MKQPLVSVIMPAYNAAAYIEEAIQSVLNQTYQNWELLIVNDGSKDDTEAKIKAFEDTRIHYFKQENQGVSAARNLALKNMKGDFFCFLDADDAYPPKSIEARLKVFKESEDIYFVDGTVLKKDADLKETLSVKKHTFVGDPRSALIRLDGSCFFGPSWMIRRDIDRTYQMKVGMTHAEDLFFYISISDKGIYKSCDEEILYYRVTDSSAMSNLKGLENGYAELYEEVKQIEGVDQEDLNYLKKRIRRIMFRSYLRNLELIKAIKAYIRFTKI